MSSADAFRRARQTLLDHRTDYDAACEHYAPPQLGAFNWALDWFDDFADGNDALALHIVDADGTEERRTFAEMKARSDRAANFLHAQGIARGDRVLLMLPNVVALWELMLAAMKIGAVVVPTTTLLAEDGLADRLERGDIRHLVAEAAQTPKFADLAPDLTRILTRIVVGSESGGAPDGWTPYAEADAAAAGFTPDAPTQATDPLLLYFTSGTTSKPKLVLHSHQSYPAGHLSTMYWIGLQEGDVHCNISSPGWAKHAWSSFFAPWNAGATIFVFRYDRFDAVRALEAITDASVTSLCAPPTVWRLIIQEDLAPYAGALKGVVSAGEPLNPKVIEAMEAAWGVTARDGYGQTETTAQIANAPGAPVKHGSMGRALPGYDVALLDPQGNEVDGEGEIALRLTPQPPLGLMQGYQGDADRTDAALGGSHYRTGDIASRDEDGYYTYVGRADDVFKSADYRISPFELESFIIKHDAVAEAAVVPSPHPTRLTVPKAYLAFNAGVEPDRALALDLFRYIRAHQSPYKRIRRIEFAELPKTVSGKIRRTELRDGEDPDGIRAENAEDERRPNEFWEEDFAGDLESENA